MNWDIFWDYWPDYVFGFLTCGTCFAIILYAYVTV